MVVAVPPVYSLQPATVKAGESIDFRKGARRFPVAGSHDFPPQAGIVHERRRQDEMIGVPGDLSPFYPP